MCTCNNWLSIESAPFNQECLVWDGYDTYKAYQTNKKSWYIKLANGEIFRDETGWAVPLTKVTHWQPLPAPPTTSGEGNNG